MLTDVLAHGGQAPAPHDVWAAWNLDPVLLLTIGLAGWIYGRGLRRSSVSGSGRAWCFGGALGAIVVGLISPLDAMSGALASAHMVQHILLLLVAAPLLVLSAPIGALLRGAPSVAVRTFGRWRRALRLTQGSLSALRDPVVVWLLHVGTIWLWHAAVPFNAALESEPIHVAEHGAFVVTGVLFWRVVIRPHAARYATNGLAVLLLFAMAVQSVFLSALLTFARTPWYGAYAETTRAWGLEPLADQQLAGVIMWVPGGAVYVGVALALLIAWLHSMDREALPPAIDARSPSDLHHARSVGEPPKSASRFHNAEATFGGRGGQKRDG